MTGSDDGTGRRELLAAVGTAGAGLLAGCTGSSPGGSGGEGGDGGSDVAWRTTALTDVRTDETFTLGGLEPPVLLETFAVWCPICARQQRQVGTLLDRREDVTAVSLNVDANEDAAAVREHAESEGFDWSFAVAPPEVTSSLREAFGTTVLNPPSAPVVRICEGSATLLETGVKSADALADSLGEC